jgi:hypothetical protein
MPGHSLGFGNLDLGDFLDLAVADARRADLQTLAPAIDDRADALQVDVPTTLGQIVSVAHPITKLGAAPTHVAYFCHKALV